MIKVLVRLRFTTFHNKTKSSGDRLCKCATINEDTATESAKVSSSNSDIQERDCIGSVNINQKGIYPTWQSYYSF